MKLSLKIKTLLFFTALSCTIEKNDVLENPKPSGKQVFEDRCTSCHGTDGKLGFGGAKNLRTSNISLDAIVNQVANGKGAMAPYKNILSEEEIFAVSHYAFSLREN